MRTKKNTKKMKETITEELKKTFRPEFLNRLDEIIVFHSLKEEQVKEIVDIMIDDLEKRMKKLDIILKLLKVQEIKLASRDLILFMELDL